MVVVDVVVVLLVVVDVVVDVVLVDVVVVVDVKVLLLCCPTCSFSPCPFLVDLENELEPLALACSREREGEREMNQVPGRGQRRRGRRRQLGGGRRRHWTVGGHTPRFIFFLSSSLSSSAQAGSSSAELREGKGEKKKLFLARQPGLLGGGGGGGGELGGHPRLHVVGRHARGGHGGLEVALFRRTDKLKKKGKKRLLFLFAGGWGLPLPLLPRLTFS